VEPKDQVLEVWGDFACFSRPELKVERFSYPIITPSAARGIFDAIYSKPNADPRQAQFGWQVTMVEILPPRDWPPGAAHAPSYIALRRNEVKEKVSVSAVAGWISGAADPEPIWADGGREVLGTDMKGRTQRQTMALRDVRYRIHAQVRPWPGHEHKLQALEAQFRRRAKGGKCVYQPYFGCREFPAFFELVEPDSVLEPPSPFDMEVGLMLYDVFDLSRPGSSSDGPRVSLFRARIQSGVMLVPDYGDAAVLKARPEVIT
jgi:CRISPR-associated protein Cas5d